MVEVIGLSLLGVSCAYWLVACWCAWAFFGAAGRQCDTYRPRVSVLKPVKGLDAEAYANYASFCQQNYSDYELLFGVLDREDPAVAVVDRLREAFPERAIRLVLAKEVGANPKVSILHHLAAEARGEVLVISDSDIRVTEDYLGRVVADLGDDQTGLVTCLYRGEEPRSLAARLEELHMDATFLPSVLVADRLTGVRAGLGATMVLRRRDLDRMGGFASIADYLADDYELAVRIGRLGKKVKLSGYVVGSVLGKTRFGEQWRREVRWARTIRVSCVWGYAGLLVTFTTPIAIGMVPWVGIWPAGLGGVGAALGVRWFVAWRMMRYLGRGMGWGNWALLPARDAMSFVVWWVGIWGRRITWRGQQFELMPDGRLRVGLERRGWFSGLLRRGIVWLDARLRRMEGIFEFSQRSDCVLRLSVGLADRDVVLSDGTEVRRGEPIGQLHMWNEHIPPIPPTGAEMAWAMGMGRRVRASLAELAAYLERDERLRHVKAFHARSTFGARDGGGQLVRIIEGFGLEHVEEGRREGLWARCHDFGEDLLVWGLTWAYNPGSLRGLELRRQRRHFWISRKALVEQYGARRGSVAGERD